MRPSLLFALAAVGLLGPGVDSDAAEVRVALVSSAVDVSVTAAGDSLLPVLSGDGRWVAFQSGAGNLVSNDVNRGVGDVFVREIATGATRLVSGNTHGESGDGPSDLVGVSRDGRRVLFVSDAGDLVAGDGNESPDVFVRDMETGVTHLVSVNTNGVSGSAASGFPAMSPDGRFVVFESDADDLVARDTNQISDVFLRDLTAGTTRRISVPSPTTLVALRGTGPSFWGSVSDDGATVVFRSSALNLTPPIPGGGQSLTNDLYFLRSPATTNRMVDVFGTVTAAPRVTLAVPSYALSADGRHVALVLASSATNLVPSGVYHVDLDTGIYQRATADLAALVDQDSAEMLSPAISDDGQTVIFEVLEAAPGTSGMSTPVVYAWEATSGRRTVVSSGGWVTNAVGEIVESKYGEFLGASRDGQFVAFLGGSTNDAPNLATRQIVVRNRSTGELRRVSRTPAGAPLDASGYPTVTFSDDGRRMAFQTANDALVAGDLNGGWDVFLYDWDTDALSLISGRATDRPSVTAFGDVVLGAGGVSGDGRYVAFLSTADGLAPGHEPGTRDAYRVDRGTGTIELASLRADGKGGGRLSSEGAAISRDGRFVAFVSAADDLVAGDTNRFEDVFLRDFEEGTTTLVNHRPDGGFVSGGASSAAISPDGRWVAFVSASVELSAFDSGNQADVFLFDRSNGNVTLVTVDSTGTSSANGASGQPTFSPDGRWLVFESRASNLVSPGVGTGRSVYARNLADGSLRRLALPVSPAFGRFPGPSPSAVFSPEGGFAAVRLVSTFVTDTDLFLHTFETKTTEWVMGTVTGVALSERAAMVAYRTSGTATNGAFQVRVWNRASGADVAVSAAPDGTPGNAPSDPPSITPDGRWVVFASAASNLVEGDDNGLSDIFVKDLETGAMLRLGGDSLSSSPVLSADGRTVVFRSFSGDLVAGDYNQTSDVFAAVLPGPESGYRITAITRLATGDLRLVWPATAGKTYRVQASSDPAGPWSDAGLTVVVDGGQGAAEVTGTGSTSPRFFRLEER